MLETIEDNTYIIGSIILLSIGVVFLIFLSWKTCIAVILIQAGVFIFHKHKRGTLARKVQKYEQMIEQGYKKLR